MGCLLGCFGSSNDGGRRRKQSRNKVQPRDHQRIVNCKPVQSAVCVIQGASESPARNPVSQVRDETEKELSFAARKKVTFDSNVKTYEHVSCDEDRNVVLESQGSGKKGEEENTAELSQSKSCSEDSSIASISGSYPLKHRYQNCRNSDDEYEELDYEDGDLEEEEEEDEDDNDGPGLEDNNFDEDDAHGIVESRRTISAPHVFTEEVKPVGSNPYARDRSVYVHPVLNPVENLSQWKAVKAKREPPLWPQKENFVSNQDPQVSSGSEPSFKELSFSFKSETNQDKNSHEDITVDASLSNWLVSSETTPVNKSGTTGLNTIPHDKSKSQESNLSRSPDDRPILGALTVEELKQFSASSSPRRSPSKSPDEMPIIGTVGTYWSHTVPAKDAGSVSSYKGIPNTTSKYREDKKVHWHSTPFETRLERALNRGVAEAYSSHTPGVCSRNL